MGLCLNDVKSSYIVFHEHFNYIVMHFRCVLYTLSPYVLLGLDWVEPMMFLLLHITCSCIFMHTYLTLSIFIYIDCVWCFFACFSLPISLSLVYVSCVMASKRKSTLSRNPLCSEASTSFDPTPSHVQFCDKKAKTDFFKNFSRQDIHLEQIGRAHV